MIFENYHFIFAFMVYDISSIITRSLCIFQAHRNAGLSAGTAGPVAPTSACARSAMPPPMGPTGQSRPRPAWTRPTSHEAHRRWPHHQHHFIARTAARTAKRSCSSVTNLTCNDTAQLASVAKRHTPRAFRFLPVAGLGPSCSVTADSGVARGSRGL